MWVRSDDTLPTSRKLGALVRALGWAARGAAGIDEAVGIVHRLWWAVMAQRPSGLLDRWTPEDVAFAVGRPADSAQGTLALGQQVSGMQVVDALMTAGFVQANEDGVLFIPGWLRRNGHRWREIARKEAVVSRGTTHPEPWESVGIPKSPMGSRGIPADSHATVRYGTERTPTDAAAPRQSVAPPPRSADGRERALALVGAVSGHSGRSRAREPWAEAIASVAKAERADGDRAKVAFQVFGKLARSGRVTDPGVIGELARHLFRHPEIRSPFAYYGEAGTAVPVLAKILAARMAVDAHRAEELATLAFLRGAVP